MKCPPFNLVIYVNAQCQRVQLPTLTHVVIYCILSQVTLVNYAINKMFQNFY